MYIGANDANDDCFFIHNSRKKCMLFWEYKVSCFLDNGKNIMTNCKCFVSFFKYSPRFTAAFCHWRWRTACFFEIIYLLISIRYRESVPPPPSPEYDLYGYNYLKIDIDFEILSKKSIIGRKLYHGFGNIFFALFEFSSKSLFCQNSIKTYWFSMCCKPVKSFFGFFGADSFEKKDQKSWRIHFFEVI